MAPLFFFGTLMDKDVLSLVLQRPLEEELQTARLAGFRRETARDACYPLLVPACGASVEGSLFCGCGPGDIARINHYEAGEYRAELRAVQLGDGSRRRAWLYMARENCLKASGQPWELERWQATGKADLLAACPDWMRAFRP
ncbi:gamma-glutamylcyclotransferase family protein [Marinimicrococcus flavescens]|uniref:Putative gamma-glutamylcyclotransferase n=1 Tax=Marinimicrococcus flavescens TaxID=3031815 RepID=A0AAP3XQ32_9PROT|nr:gamma-glutamylcyclotransferase [Marinimicrococcus flavescens]